MPIPLRIQIICALLWLALMGGMPSARAQGLSAGTAEALLAMAARADVIFTGQVLAVTRMDVAGYVEVRFQVEDAVRGCGPEPVYVLREWSGLWTDAPRYTAGERRLMLLHGAGPSGLSSPVEGMDGAIPVVTEDASVNAGEAGLAAAAMGAAAIGQVAAAGVGPMDAGRGGESSAPRLDLRWVQARSRRAASGESEGLQRDVRGAGLRTGESATGAETLWGSVASAPADAGEAKPEYGAVLDLLRGRVSQGKPGQQHGGQHGGR